MSNWSSMPARSPPAVRGHSHADTLSLVLRQGQEQILIDPGTYTYVADPLWRDRFRGTAAHNTVRIDGLDQGIPSGTLCLADAARCRGPRLGEFPPRRIF